MAVNKISLLTEVSSQKIKQQRTVLNCREQSKTHPEHFLVVALESSGAYSGLSLGMPFFCKVKMEMQLDFLSSGVWEQSHQEVFSYLHYSNFLKRA